METEPGLKETDRDLNTDENRGEKNISEAGDVSGDDQMTTLAEELDPGMENKILFFCSGSFKSLSLDIWLKECPFVTEV